MVEDDDVEDSDDEEARELANYATEGLDEHNREIEPQETKQTKPSKPSKSSKEESKTSETKSSPGRAGSSGSTGSLSSFNVAGEGKKVLEPRDIGKCALEILEILVGLHQSLDSTGAAVRPPPRAKRLISDRREMQLTHVAQMMLTAEPAIVSFQAFWTVFLNVYG